MHPILRNILAVIAGIITGGAVNMGIIILSGSMIPPPAGVDPSNLESIRSHIDLYQPVHFLFPFLAHALGTLVSALVAAKLAATHKMTFAWVFGLLGLAGGIMAAMEIPAPTWFIVVDLGLAYLPMAWLGGRMGART